MARSVNVRSIVPLALLVACVELITWSALWKCTKSLTLASEPYNVVACTSANLAAELPRSCVLSALGIISEATSAVNVTVSVAASPNVMLP